MTENIIREIESEIRVTESQLADLRKLLEVARGIPISGTHHNIAIVELPDGRYRGQTAGAALRQFMQNKKSATLDEIRDALDRGGLIWGKYPKRQVKLAVVNLPKVYAINGDLVTLIPSS
jgi:hypothetical protein